MGSKFLAVAATDEDDRNAAVVQAAVRNGALACDASSAERSQVIFGALLQSEDVTIAVFTDGRDPALARRTRDQITDLIGQDRKLKPQP
jgi:siroheme synthase (precorrin-2 oxidase/ferrochelatase)